ncbi:PREDICTED: uncharacterized protein LOC106806348 [Priapulus caudatus]|uniref:Uncharacterized protein LOC106806348 n=1 Tax=Priapulus caudatus TaxID=37621 RepID=A0ABM1DUX2_PRICU|nr:PREDICTED: uncharacterized protein LOC106806348 [Priapulus caudatus]
MSAGTLRTGPPSIIGSGSASVFRSSGKSKTAAINRQRKKSLPEEWWWEFEGEARLCFTSNASSFQGDLTNDASDDLFGIEGSTVSTEGRLAVEMKVVDYDVVRVHSLTNVAMTMHGGRCELKSDTVSFTTERMLTGEHADMFIRQNFSHNLVGQQRFVCIGNMRLTIKKTKAEELCYCPTNYIL